ncbi:MAG: 2-hydroxyacyl-CoA dehydratase [Chloroflexi bacterium]|nr:2-hydroxyacyl-CoA dehydratase [Chloroflexota bacterium]
MPALTHSDFLRYAEVIPVHIEEIVTKCREIVEDPTFAVVADWKAAHPGAKAVGCFPVYTPVELIHATGMLPAGVIGGGNQIEIAYADSRFQSFVCSVVKSTMELGLTGRLKVFDGMVFHSICDPARNLAAVFKRNFPDQQIEYIHFTQNMESPSSLEYMVGEYGRLKSAYEQLAGRRVDDADIRRSIAAYNRTRSLVRQLYAIRRERPHLVSATESYALVKAGTRLMPEEHERILREALAAIESRDAKPKDRIKVVIEGSFCEQPPIELIQTIEEAGCYILDDDLLLGWRWFKQDVPEEGDPLRALAQSYIDRSVYSSVKHDLREPKATHLIEKAKSYGAAAVICLDAKFCEPALFDYPLFRKALDENGIPHVALEFEEKMWIFDSIQTEIETFVESMLFD